MKQTSEGFVCESCAKHDPYLMEYDDFITKMFGECVLAIGRGDFKSTFASVINIAHRRGYNNAKKGTR